jgi:hypothetical protein
MRQLIMMVAFAFIVVGGGAAVTVAQDEDQGTPEVGTPVVCGTPIASPPAVLGASPEGDEIAIAVGTAIVSLDASPGASPMAGDPCTGAPPAVE